MTESECGVWAAARPLAGVSLYAPDAEQDSCGVAFVATLRGTPGRDIVDAGLSALLNLDHRGSSGADMASGDGAGILTQIPDAFLRDVIPGELPPSGSYAVGMAFLPSDEDATAQAQAAVANLAMEEGLAVLAWRDVPVVVDVLADGARRSVPSMQQIVVRSAQGTLSGVELDRLTFRLRKRAEHELGISFASLSSRTLVYKGMLTTTQLEPFFADLSDPRYASEIALVHARFSTSTESSWEQAQPMRFVAHNGQFTSRRGNRDWARGREGALESSALGDIHPLLPICTVGGSDSMHFDEVVELLHLDGRSLPHAVLMLLPEAWEDDLEMRPDRRAFYEYHARVVEPWDGPASLNFTDGTLIGTVLDRNALRPSRFWVTEDGLVVLASETGVLDIDPATVVRKGRIEPGKMFVVDTRQGRIIEDDEIKSFVTTRRPYAQWLAEHEVVLDQLLGSKGSGVTNAVGATEGSTAERGDAVGGENLFDRFRPIQAELTTAPLEVDDAAKFSALSSAIGPEKNMLSETPLHARKLVLRTPVLTAGQSQGLMSLGEVGTSRLTTRVVPLGYSAGSGGAGLASAIERICALVDEAVVAKVDLVVLSDRALDRAEEPMPTALATSAVHQHLVKRARRGSVALIVESGDARNAQDVACLLSLGAAAVNPYVAIERLGENGTESDTAVVQRLSSGVRDLMLAFGVSTLKSYRGALAFEAIGLAGPVLEDYFPGTPGWPGSFGLERIVGAPEQILEDEAIGNSTTLSMLCDSVAISLGAVESDAVIRERFTYRPDQQDAVLRLCPHRTGLDAATLSSAECIRIDFADCTCTSAPGTVAHLDAVSLEDLAQLVHDLKNASPQADIQVVLSAQYGIGAVAAGAAKAHADSVVVVARSSSVSESRLPAADLLPYALRECHETLLRLGLRGRVKLGVDAVMTSADDIVSCALLGADFIGLLGAESCADQLASETRQRLADLGLSSFADLVGRGETVRLPQPTGSTSDRAGAPVQGVGPVVEHEGQDHGLAYAVDQQLIVDAAAALDNGDRVSLAVPVRNVNRSVGTLLGHEVVKRVGMSGLAHDTITVTLTGSAGQSFGAFLPQGVTLHLFGDANDFVAKGLSGGAVVIRPDSAAVLTGTDNLIAGNVIGYGATSGVVFVRGQAGDRFAVRNQGACFIVEGVGDAACQHMSGGTVVILGQVGRHLASGMTGGTIYVLDLAPTAVAQADRVRPKSGDLADDDIVQLIDLLERHQKATGSRIAVELLADHDQIANRFTKISSSGLAPERTSRLSSAEIEL